MVILNESSVRHGHLDFVLKGVACYPLERGTPAGGVVGVEGQDLSPRLRRGGPPTHPRMMVKVLLYGYCTGVASSRRIAQLLHEEFAFRVVFAANPPPPTSALSRISARTI